jgi:hypothetical protein
VETEEEMADSAEVNKPRGGWRKRMIRRWYDANHELVHEDYQKDFEKFYVTVNKRITDHRKVDKKRQLLEPGFYPPGYHGLLLLPQLLPQAGLGLGAPLAADPLPGIFAGNPPAESGTGAAAPPSPKVAPKQPLPAGSSDSDSEGLMIEDSSDSDSSAAPPPNLGYCPPPKKRKASPPASPKAPKAMEDKAAVRNCQQADQAQLQEAKESDAAAAAAAEAAVLRDLQLMHPELPPHAAAKAAQDAVREAAEQKEAFAQKAAEDAAKAAAEEKAALEQKAAEEKAAAKLKAAEEKAVALEQEAAEEKAAAELKAAEEKGGEALPFSEGHADEDPGGAAPALIRSERSSTGFKGVCPFKGKYRAQLCRDGRHKAEWLGDFDTAEAASLVYSKRVALQESGRQEVVVVIESLKQAPPSPSPGVAPKPASSPFPPSSLLRHHSPLAPG